MARSSCQTWALKQRPGSPALLAVLLCLAKHADRDKRQDGSAVVSQATIADELAVSTDTVGRAVPRLMASGYIVRVRRHDPKGHRAADEFHLNLTREEQGEWQPATAEPKPQTAALTQEPKPQNADLAQRPNPQNAELAQRPRPQIAGARSSKEEGRRERKRAREELEPEGQRQLVLVEPDLCRQAVESYNDNARPMGLVLYDVNDLSKDRTRALKGHLQRLGLDGWREVMARLQDLTPFYRGEGKSDFKVDLGWLLRSRENFERLRNGELGQPQAPGTRKPSKPGKQTTADLDQAFDDLNREFGKHGIN